MRINSNDMEFLVGNFDILNNMANVPVLPAFSDKAVDFLSELSKELLNDKRVRGYIDVISYAYWIRRSSLSSAKNKHPDHKNRLGRGIALHIAPSNVPVNFAVSMTSSVLAGNINIIRVSNKQFEQVNIISDALNTLLNGKFLDLKPYFCIIRYEHSDLITQELSSICDVRIIWGGNRTIETIRHAKLPPRGIEMTFADRFSVAVVNSEKYLQSDIKKTAKGFYTDTYYTDQNACSSPRIVVWTGDKIKEAKEIFWKELAVLVKNDYDMKPVQAVDKYNSFCSLAMASQNVSLNKQGNNLIMRIDVGELTPDIMDYKNGGGYFFEYEAKNLSEIVPILTKQCQTISFLGENKEEIKELVFKNGVRGVDRIVPLGETMGLEFIWDGYKMIENMSRFVYSGE